MKPRLLSFGMPDVVARGDPRNLFDQLQGNLIAGFSGAAAAIAGQHATNIGANLAERLNSGVASAADLFQSYGVEVPTSSLKRPGDPLHTSTPNKQSNTRAEPDMSAGTAMDETVPMIDGAPTSLAASTGPSTSATQFSDVATLSGIQSAPQLQRTYFKKQRRFVINVQSASTSKAPKPYGKLANLNQLVFQDDWHAIPYKSSGFYMSERELHSLKTGCSKFRIVKAGYRMSNFSSHTGNVQTGGPSLNMHYGGVGFDSLVIDQRLLGPHKIGTFDYQDFYHDDIARIMMEGGYSEYPFHLFYQPSEIVMNGTKNLFSVRHLEKMATFQLGSPAVTSAIFEAPPKRWFSTFENRSFIYNLGVKQDALAGLQIPQYDTGGLMNIVPWTSDDLKAAAVTVNDSPYLVAQPNRSNRTSFVRDSALNLKRNMERGFNVFPADGAPPSFFNNTWNSATRGMQGNATHYTTDVHLFRPVLPPTPDGSDPNVMVSFTMETICEVEYLPIIGDNSQSFGPIMRVLDNTSNGTATYDYQVDYDSFDNLGRFTDHGHDVPIHFADYNKPKYSGVDGNDYVTFDEATNHFFN